jgi:hypothetical protein
MKLDLPVGRQSSDRNLRPVDLRQFAEPNAVLIIVADVELFHRPPPNLFHPGQKKISGQGRGLYVGNPTNAITFDWIARWRTLQATIRTAEIGQTASLYRVGLMSDRSDEFRNLAAECVAIARTTSDPAARVTLLTMAQKWFDLANGPTASLDGALREFNASQMSDARTPAMQQQQQIQPKKDQ